MMASAGDTMWIKGKRVVAVRCAKQRDCKNCAVRGLVGRKRCIRYCETVDYSREVERYLRWEEFRKPIIPVKKR